MQLTDVQKQDVSQWIANGSKLSEVQQRLAEEFGIRLTYMEARFLVDDLKLIPQDKEEPAKTPDAPADSELDALDEPAPGAATGGVRLSVDEIVRPGALVSGRVTFSDGMKAEWSLDRAGRFGLMPEQEGYRPSQADLTEFRKGLETALARQGL
jgi:hypothetical protein